MFERIGDVYTVDGVEVRWVGVVTHLEYDTGNIRAVEMAYNKRSGEFLSINAQAHFNINRPGQRILLQEVPKKEVSK